MVVVVMTMVREIFKFQLVREGGWTGAAGNVIK